MRTAGSRKTLRCERTTLPSRGVRRDPEGTSIIGHGSRRCQLRVGAVSGTNSLSGVVAHELSGWMGTEDVPHDQDTVATGGPADEIQESLRGRPNHVVRAGVLDHAPGGFVAGVQRVEGHDASGEVECQ